MTFDINDIDLSNYRLMFHDPVRLSSLGVPMRLIEGVRSFYSNYVSRLRIGTMLTAPYFVTSGTNNNGSLLSVLISLCH
jgi:hypothetical protein